MIYEIEGLVPNQTDENGVTFTGSTGVSISPSNITTDTLVYATIATDPDPIFNFKGEETDFILRLESEAFILRSEQGVFYGPYLEMTWTDTFGETFLETINIKL